MSTSRPKGSVKRVVIVGAGVGGLTAAAVFARNLWLVGDSIFPGQSIAAVALGGLRVARLALHENGLRTVPPMAKPTAQAEVEK